MKHQAKVTKVLPWCVNGKDAVFLARDCRCTKLAARTVKALIMVGSLLPIPSSAFDLRVVHVGGLYATTPEQATEVYHCAAPYFKKLGITFRLKWAGMDQNPCINSHSLVARDKEFKCFKVFAAERMSLITYVMTPPFVTVDEPAGVQTGWIGGLADVCGNLSTGNAESVSLTAGVLGASYINQSGTIMAHEIAHNLCATHTDDGPNLMHPNANAFTKDYGCNLPVLRATTRQVKRYKARFRNRNK